MTSTLYVCATPIGNLADASPRLVETLGEVDVVYAEDTRRTGRLLQALGVTADLRSYFVGNELSRSDEIRRHLEAGRDVAVVTDAGSPAVSDPGRTAIEAARAAGARVTVVPGPSAVTAAVSASGMVEDAFVFEGFLARKGRDRAAQLERIATETRPTVLFLSPHRVVTDLAALETACGADRGVFIARELTKLHEELWWGSLGEAVRHWGEREPRGEFTLVVAGAPAAKPNQERAVELARELMDRGMTASQAAREAAASTGVGRRAIYEDLLR